MGQIDNSIKAKMCCDRRRMVWKSTGRDIDLAPLRSRSQAQAQNVGLVGKVGITDIGGIEGLFNAAHSVPCQAAKASEPSAWIGENGLEEQTGAEQGAFQLDDERAVPSKRDQRPFGRVFRPRLLPH